MSRSKTQLESQNSIAIAYLAIALLISFWGNDTFAQSNIVPDETLGSENSQVIPNFRGRPVEQIEGGARRGANLFHSFREFNIDEGRGAYFTNPAGVENILSRVTGTNPSNIFGTLGVLGNANLFLINPNGIIFGQNASLDVKGSFVATTANAVQFGNRGFFSASEPNAPSLLTVKPSAFLFNQIARGSIENNSIAPAGLDPSKQFNTFGLRVPDGQSLLLLGGDININSAGLFAFGGRVELGGISGEGTVRLKTEGNNLSLSFPNNVARADVSLTNGAFVDVTAGGGGSIAIAARNFKLAEGSGLLAGIGEGLGSAKAQAGNVTIQATENVIIQGARSLSFIDNSVNSGGIGNAGDIIINTGNLIVLNGAQISLGTRGEGASGNLTVNATDSVQVIGTSSDGLFASSLSAQTLNRGEAGRINIETGNLIVRDGARVSLETFGEGAGGNLKVNAADSVQVIGTSADGRFASGLFAETLNRGEAGNLSINTENLIVRDGAQVSFGTVGEGAGGSLTVNATDSVQVIGTSADGRFASRLFADTESRGEAGKININTGNLIVRDGARLSSGTRGEGAGGSFDS